MTDGVGERGVGFGASASVYESSQERSGEGRSGEEDGHLGVGGVRLAARGDSKRGLCR